ncbi:tRNA:m(4)X modification enzyme TRM13 [Candida viswanathii]|uniref:tRNA:m(4)X modification enzyme TRM13 n=1 Tax=Candida viswanathii TaxID=5486 RepID=A0A367YL01_9ASCO|nr:tRNA:m(4)X modification enzyme TRM13 [Candida viswanathii]
MLRKKDVKYCSEHMIHDEKFQSERIPCPYNSNHTIWKKELEQHLLKCNEKPKAATEPWFDLNCNRDLKGVENFDLEQEEESEDLVEKYISVLQGLSYEPLQFKVYHHEGLQSRLDEKTNQKHPIQQNSLIANLKTMQLLNESFFYLEFGCGKGELLRYLNQCILQQDPSESSTYGFGLIDRGKNRMKADSKMILDCEQAALTPQVKRSKIDIKDFDLDKFIADLTIDKVVGISKHLCGAATDLTLKLILNSSVLQNNQLGGVLIAMCCRHACSLDQLLPQSRKYLYDHGFETVQSFNVLKKLVSWAVDKKNETEVDKYGLDFHQRENLGLVARRLLDESRVHAVKSALGDNYNVEMFWYVEKEITLENVCLSISKNQQH